MRCLLIFICSWLTVLVVVPPIILVTQKSKMMDEPSESRKIHKLNVPNSGGIAIFVGFLFSCLVLIPFNLLPQANILMAAALIVFAMGLMDDIASLAPYKKFIAQFIAGIMVCVIADIRITNLYGLFGIDELPYMVSISLTLVSIVGIVNAFNLLDGIDGLAGAIGVLLCIFFAILFYQVKQLGYTYLAIALGAALIGFLRFNLTPARIFMGDSGSLFLGFVIVVLCLRIANVDVMSKLWFGSIKIKSGIGLLLAALIIPVFDTLRVFTIRIFNGKSPFSADSNHLHHRLLFLGFSHRKAVLILLGTNICFVLVAIWFQDIGNTLLVLTLSLMAIGLNIVLTKLVSKEKISSKKSLSRELIT